MRFAICLNAKYWGRGVYPCLPRLLGRREAPLTVTVHIEAQDIHKSTFTNQNCYACA